MAIREIVTFPDERLRQICTPVTEFDAALKELTDDMFETMYDDEGQERVEQGRDARCRGAIDEEGLRRHR